jgi:hypothetical protein
LTCTDFKAEDLDVFIQQLHHSGQNSVDAFLEYRREFMDIGKAAMSIILIGCENAKSLYEPRDPTENWLRYLLRMKLAL